MADNIIANIVTATAGIMPPQEVVRKHNYSEMTLDATVGSTMERHSLPLLNNYRV